jgi:hypothetical protein
VDQGYTGPNDAEAAQKHSLQLKVVKHPMAKRGFVLLPRRWVVERSLAWAARFHRLARDYKRLDTTLKGLHLLACVVLMLRIRSERLLVEQIDYNLLFRWFTSAWTMRSGTTRCFRKEPRPVADQRGGTVVLQRGQPAGEALHER